MKTYEEYIEEKLDIKPMSKARLANMRLIHNSNGWKEKLQTGDKVLLQFNDVDTILCTFVKYQDYEKHYKELLDLRNVERSSASRNGFLVIPPTYVSYFTFIGLGYFKPDCMEGVANYNQKIKAIYRYNVKPESLVGCAGSVYLSIPAGNQRGGRVTLVLPSSTVEVEAVADEALETGSPVVVEQYLGNNVYKVVKKL